MKIIALAGSNKYIAEIDHAEVEKFFNLYYGKMKELKIGANIDLGRGYDWSFEIKTAMNTTKKFIEDNQKIISAIMNGFTILSDTTLKKEKKK